MSLDVYLYTNPGGREENQDSAVFRQEGDSGLFVVADGLGGHKGGRQASELVTKTLAAAWDRREQGEFREDWLQEQILKANEAVLALQSEQNGRMKSTVAALALQDGNAWWSSVGDSRLYCLTAGMITRVSRDHSVTYTKFLSGEISRDGMNFDEDRSSLLRVVGDPTRCIPEGGVLPGQAGDGTAFLLCSDGFWEYLYEEEILFDCLKSDCARDWVEQLLLRILPRMKPDSDNLTCLAVMIKGETRE